MNTIRSSHVLSSLVAGATLMMAPGLHAQESFDPTGKEAEATLPHLIRTQVEYIEMSLEQMTALLADPAATKTDTILRQRINELIKQEKAEIIDTQMVISRSGEKSTSESIREFIYPTEYEPPELPNKIHLHTQDGKTEIPNKELATGPTPTAFETRNLGSTLEVEPTLSENKQYVDLRFAPELVYHVENVKWATWKDKHGEADIQMPIMYTLRVNTAVSVYNHRPCLVAALSPKDDKGITDRSRKVLVFVRCDVVPVGR
ncbi:hypothetical protein HW115_09245 [Verrucomicrobiaceae bacterium N1E253]|uniref:Uncharacterized protein n=1 Tax=Oceaniferula marina TaxID=2748318 RepID=A0A851GNT4_9BACT|nr:hypothetical protein [Oceaniferula marina]NWK55794.1 hypothetical protein [Oceaniferula marina]